MTQFQKAKKIIQAERGDTDTESKRRPGDVRGSGDVKSGQAKGGKKGDRDTKRQSTQGVRQKERVERSQVAQSVTLGVCEAQMTISEFSLHCLSLATVRATATA